MKLRHVSIPLLFSAGVALAQAAPAPTTAPASEAATRPAFTLGKDTTRITAPLLPDGRPDYVTYLDQTLSKGVTPENNALVGLLEVFGTGPNVISKKIHDEALKRLGIKEDYASTFLPFPQYLKRQNLEYNADMQDQEALARKHPWDTDEFPEIARWLADTGPALDQVVKAASRDRYYWPMIATTDRAAMINSLLPSLGLLRSVANALTERAMLRLDKGQILECQADLIAVHRLGRLASQGPTLIEKLVGMALETTAAQGDVEIADGLKPDAVRAYLAELAKLPPLDEIAASVDQAERFTMLDAVLSVSKYGMSGLVDADGNTLAGDVAGDLDTANVDWDKVLKRMNGRYDRMTEAMRKPTHAERTTAMATLEKELNEVKVKATDLTITDVTERVTDMLTALLLPSLGKARELADRAQEHTDLATLAIALAAHRGDKGVYPDKLEDLAPAYLKEIPQDIFADAPLKYHKDGTGYLLYSIGPDLKDDGGIPGKNDSTGDIVVKMSK